MIIFYFILHIIKYNIYIYIYNILIRRGLKFKPIKVKKVIKKKKKKKKKNLKKKKKKKKIKKKI